MSSVAHAAGALAVKLEAAPQYVLGFPLVMAVTVENRGPKAPVDSLSGWTLLASMAPLDFAFTDETGTTMWARSAAMPKDEPRGFSLMPGQARRMPFDVSTLAPMLHPGAWRVRVRFHERQWEAESPEISVRLVAADGEDVQALARLLAGLNERSWSEFLGGNWRTVEAPPMSATAREQTSLHLVLHRVTYGPEKVAESDLAWLRPIANGVWAPEAAAMRYEILAARHDAGAAVAGDEVVRRWPALTWRVDAIRRGHGFLQGLRSFWGVERSRNPPSPATPYRR